jgi:hypothetical protein
MSRTEEIAIAQPTGAVFVFSPDSITSVVDEPLVGRFALTALCMESKIESARNWNVIEASWRCA